MKIELTQGYFALIDASDYEKVSKHCWCVQQYKDKDRCQKIYAKASVGGTQVTMHRFLLSPPKHLSVDHINGNSLDNRRENLRLTNKKGNAANRPKDRIKGATSKFKGVHKATGGKKWLSRIHVNGKGIYLGSFEKEIDAARAYDIAAKYYFGEFACLNLSA
jgi:hypothetical protein